MAIFRNSLVRTMGVLLALLVFSGDVLDDVWNVPGSTVNHSQASDQQKGGAPKTSSAGHDDTVVINNPLGSLVPAPPRTFRYLDIEQDAPVGAPPSIDHPPQLA